jgi:hypothetical protein
VDVRLSFSYLHPPCAERGSEAHILERLDAKTLRLIAATVPIIALAVLHRLAKGRRFWPAALTLCAPLLFLLVYPPKPYRDSPAATVEAGDYLFEYTLTLVLSAEALAISRLTVRLRWPVYLIACFTLTLMAWVLSACSVGCLASS